MSERRRTRLLLLALTLLIAGLHLWLAQEVSIARRGPGDQWGYLGSARFLAGDPHIYVLPFFPYFSYGYSILLAPLTQVFDGPPDLFLAIKVLNAALMASVLPLAYVFGRRVLGASPSQAVVAATAAALAPPCLAHPSSILAENLVLPLTIATALAAWLFVTERRTWMRLLVAPSVVWLVITHNRFVVVLPVLGLLLLAAWRARLAPGRIVAANGVLVAGLLVATEAVRARIVEARWVDGIEVLQGPAVDALDVLRQRNLLQAFLLEAVGQAWYLAVATAGLSALGIVAVSAAIRGGSHRAWRSAWRDPSRLALLFVVLAALGVFVTSTYFFTRVTNGTEGFIAGRHNDSFVPIWIAAGVVAVQVHGHRARALVAAAGVAAAIVALSGVLLLGRQPADWRGSISSLNAPAAVHYAGLDEHLVPVMGAVAIGALCLGAGALLLRRRAWLALPVVVAWLVVSVGTEVVPDAYYAAHAPPGLLERVRVDRAAIVQQRNDGVPPNYLFYLPELHAIPWSGRGNPPEPYVLARTDLPRLLELGARLAAVDPIIERFADDPYRVGLWVIPGAEQDRLAAAGELLPADFPSALPAEAQVADIALLGGDRAAPLPVAPGRSVTLDVRVRHRGQASPWPDVESVGPHGSVGLRVELRGAPTDASPSVTTISALPRWLRPGEWAIVSLSVTAADAAGRPLPPGQYDTSVQLEQVGYGTFPVSTASEVHVVLTVG